MVGGRNPLVARCSGTPLILSLKTEAEAGKLGINLGTARPYPKNKTKKNKEKEESGLPVPGMWAAGEGQDENPGG